MKLVAFFFSLGPILFGIGFLAPVIVALLNVAGIAHPLGLSPTSFGLVIGILLGVIARQRRAWLW